MDAPQGHDSFLLEIDDYINVMRAYLNRVANQSQTNIAGNDHE